MEEKAALLAQHQLDAYNQQNIEEFLEVFTEDVVVMHFPGERGSIYRER
jgi:hypothetical protein